MPLNPLLKLKRFVSAPAAPQPSEQVQPSTSNAPQKSVGAPSQQAPAPTLSRDEIEKLINPQSRNCTHCGVHHTKVKFIWYSEGPSYKGWYCFDCWAYHYKHHVFPPLTPVRAIPKKVPSVKAAS